MNAKPQPSIDRIAAAMNKYLVPAAQNQPIKKKDIVSKSDSK
jgi:hypothetical protein